MTLDLDNLRKLDAAAQSAPWEHVAVRHMQHDVYTAEDEGHATIDTWHAADAALIAAMRNSLPTLLADHARLVEVERNTPGSQRDAYHTFRRLAAVMGCEHEGSDDLIEAVRLLVTERDAERDAHHATCDALARERAEVARLERLVDAWETEAHEDAPGPGLVAEVARLRGLVERACDGWQHAAHPHHQRSWSLESGRIAAIRKEAAGE